MKRVKRKHKNQIVYHPKMQAPINTNDIQPEDIEYLTKLCYLGHLFEEVPEKKEPTPKPKKKTEAKKGNVITNKK